MLVVTPGPIGDAAAIIPVGTSWVLMLGADRVMVAALIATLTGDGWGWRDMTITEGSHNPAGEHELLDRINRVVVGGLDQADRDDLHAVLAGLRVDVDPGSGDDAPPLPAPDRPARST